jgi:hypothetical protein
VRLTTDCNEAQLLRLRIAVNEKMTNQAKQPLIVWWILWAAFQSGIFFIYYYLRTPGGRGPSGAESAVWLAGAVPMFLSLVVRWVVLPRVQNGQIAFPLFIIGIALAEATCFMGLFIFPAQRLALFILSAAGIFQFIPIYAGRYVGEKDEV